MDYFTRLPDEVTLHIFLQLHSIKELLNVLSTCHRFNAIHDASLWRDRCVKDFENWDGRHQIHALLASPLNQVDWKSVYKQRQSVNKITQSTLDAILSSQSGRLEKVGKLTALGDDVRDVLSMNLSTPNSASDVLARRWYADALFGHMQRAKAVLVWAKLASAEKPPLEQALLCFDQFILGEKALDFDQVLAILDKLAISISESFPDWSNFRTRDKATAIANYLLERNLVGLDQHHRYLDIRNNLLSVALSHPEHPSLPLISTVIYCAVARRLGLKASPCGFPMHIYTIVFAREGHDLDDNPVSQSSDSQDTRMYLDPFRNAQEVPESQLVNSLPQMGIRTRDIRALLVAARDQDIVVRCGRNILNAVQELHVASHTEDSLGIQPETALYASMWSRLLLSGSDTDVDPDLLSRRHFLPHLISLFESHHPFDAKLVQDYVCPLFEASTQLGVLRSHIRNIISRDSFSRDSKPRLLSNQDNVKYFIGQLFRHKRYEYEGVICGWDPECRMPEDWVRRMRVSDLDRGEKQPFYHILAGDSSTRYVAEDNIRIITPDDPPTTILRKAGQFFKRWDSSRKVFISNLRDEYPDD